MTLRRLSADDVVALRALWLEGLRDMPASFLTTPDELLARSDAQLTAGIGSYLYLGSFDQDHLVGFAVARQGGMTRLRHTADIGPLYVTPSHQRQGRADALLRSMLKELREDKLLQAELSVDAANVAAIALYESLGFVTFGRRPRSVMIDGAPRDDLLMIVALDGYDLSTET